MRGEINVQNAFSLIETLVATSIFVLIAILGGNFIVTGFRSITFGSEQDTAISTARQVMEIMTKEIRGANNSEQGDYPLNTVEGDEFIFFSDIEYDGQAEKVRYYLNGSLLKKEVTEPGAARDYSAPGTTVTIAEYVNNQAENIFQYYNSANSETSDIDDIRLVHIELKINVTPERAPNDFYVETDVHLRNLKSNL